VFEIPIFSMADFVCFKF